MYFLDWKSYGFFEKIGTHSVHVATAPCLYADWLTSSLETIGPRRVFLIDSLRTTRFVNDTESSHTCYLFKVKQ